ncbi:hypothetical protein MASR2M78_03920 [Treponema sp.]
MQNAVELAPDDKRIYKAYLNALLVRGLRLIRGSETELGEQMLLFVLNNGLELPLPHLELGRLYKGAGRLTEALDQYDKAISLSPKDSKLHWYRASLLMALGKDEEARSELSILTDLGSEIPDLEWNAELVDRFLIRSLIEHKDWRRAAEACKVWLKKRKSDPTIHAMLAEALRNLGDYEAAFNHAQRAVESSKDTEPRYALLLILYESEDWKQLKTELIKSERLGLDSEVLLRFTALLGAKTDPDDKKVISLIQEAIRQTGPAPELMFALAERYFRLGLSDLAENWYRKTRTIEKGHERAYLGEIAAAENLLEGGEEEAEDRLRLAYEEYLELWSDNLSIKREYALFLVRQGHYKGASEELRELLAWEPRNATLRRLLAYTYRKTKRYREAAVLLKGLLREQPRELEILMEYVACLQKAKAKEYALAVLEKALPLFPKNSVPVRALAELYLKNGKKEKAIEMYSKAAALSKTDSRSRRALAELYLSSGLGELAQRYENEANMLDNKQGITDSDARKSRV